MRVGPNTVIGARSVVGAGTQLGANVTLEASVTLGARCTVHSGAVIGSRGFGLAMDAGRWIEVPQLGSVVIGDDVEIGANTMIDRGAVEDTVIGYGVKIDNQVQIAHNCDIGEDVLIAAQSGLSGNTTIEARAILMARCATTGHLTIGAGAFLAANTGVHHDVPAGARLYGAPAMEERGWHRTVAALKRLPELIKRVRRLERAIDQDRD